VFSSPEAIEALAVRVDLALHNINAEMKSVKDKYDADCKRYEEFKARPFFTRLFQSAPCVDGTDYMFRLPALRYHASLISDINRMIACGASEVRVNADAMNRIFEWSE
jgi:hypothetical protein